MAAGRGVLRFHCARGAKLLGSAVLVCDGRRYNDSAPLCLTGPSRVAVAGPRLASRGGLLYLECIHSILTLSTEYLHKIDKNFIYFKSIFNN